MMVNPFPTLWSLPLFSREIGIYEWHGHFLGLAHYNFIHTSLSCINVSFHIHVGHHWSKDWNWFQPSKVYTKYLQFLCKGHGNGCATSRTVINSDLEPCALSNTAHPPMQCKSTKPAQFIVGTDTNTALASKITAQWANNVPKFVLLVTNLSATVDSVYKPL